MASNIDQYLANVDKLLTALPAEAQRINDGLALSVIPLIIGRLTDFGVDGLGKKLGTYSTNPLPMFFYLNKVTGSGADEKLKALDKQKRKEQGKNYKGISYEEFRQVNNKEVEFVNLNFTGETLNDIGVLDNVINGILVVTTIGAQGKINKGKITTEQVLDFLAERYGENILAINEDEEKIMTQAYDEELQKVFDKYLEV